MYKRMTFSKRNRKQTMSISEEDREAMVKKQIIAKNEKWYKAVTSVYNKTLNTETGKLFSGTDVANLFCEDGILWGTQSTKIRNTRQDIIDYFDFFANIPGITIKAVDNNVTKITDMVYVNNANVTWFWDDLEEPVVARMTFIYRLSNGNWCLFELHGSALPEKNPNLKPNYLELVKAV